MIWGDVNVNVRKADLPGPSRLNLILYNRVGRLVARQTVSPHGRYRFTNLPAGEYELAIEVENGEVTRIHFDLNGSPDSDFRQDLQFEWKTKPSHAKSTPGIISAADAYSRSSANNALFQKAEEATDKKKYDDAASYLKQIVEKHITKEMDIDGNKKMDWFFDEWVYGMEMPNYRFDYQLSADGNLSGKITQSNVSNKFVMRVPVYVDFGKGWQRIGAATVVGNSSVELNNVKLPKGAKRASVCALNDVLAASIQNSK